MRSDGLGRVGRYSALCPLFLSLFLSPSHIPILEFICHSFTIYLSLTHWLLHPVYKEPTLLYRVSITHISMKVAVIACFLLRVQVINIRGATVPQSYVMHVISNKNDIARLTSSSVGKRIRIYAQRLRRNGLRFSPYNYHRNRCVIKQCSRHEAQS